MYACKVAILSFLTLWPTVVKAQQAPLTIVTPTNGTIVTPGQVITVVVTGEPTIQGTEAVIGHSPMAVSDQQAAGTTRQFQLTIPETVDPGTYSIAAITANQKTKGLRSATVSLIVPVVFAVQTISVSNGHLTFYYPGQRSLLDTRETTSDGFKIMEADLLSFRSANPAIASVDNAGNVTAGGPGTTQVTVSYGGVSASVSVVVKSTGVTGDLTGDSKVDLNDLNILEQWLNTTANGPNDARDLNHDGKIDALDARILTTLCTYPHCATHQ